MTRIASLLGAVALVGLASSGALAQGCDRSGTVGSGGSAAAGGTAAATLGTAGACTTDDGTTGSIASGGSAAAADGRADSRTHVIDTNGGLKAQSDAMAQDQGTWSKSKTRTRVGKDGDLSSTTRSMSHVPGEKPTKSTTSVDGGGCDSPSGTCP